MAELDVFSRKIADALRELAVERGQSQSSLAEISGVSQGQISRIFSHKRSVSVEDLALLAIALGTSASEIAARAEEAVAAGDGASLTILDGGGSGGAKGGGDNEAEIISLEPLHADLPPTMIPTVTLSAEDLSVPAAAKTSPDMKKKVKPHAKEPEAD